MAVMQKVSAGKKRWDHKIRTVLRRVSIFRRLNLSFMLLILAAAIFLTFFSFYKYSAEIGTTINRYSSLLVQNVELKIQDTMQEYEEEALTFYDNSRVIRALVENAKLDPLQSEADKEQYEKNRYYVESQLYAMRHNQKHIVNVQFVTPKEQYNMVEPDGYRRGGCIRNLEQFYTTDIYLVPQEKKGYPVWFDMAEQTNIFYPNEQSIYGYPDIITLGIGVYAPVNREFLGVLLMNVNLGAFSGAMEGYGTYNDGNTFLVGEDGILKWFNPSIMAPAFPKDDQLFGELMQDGQGIKEKTIDGKRVILAYERIPDTGMLVAYIAELAVLYKGTYQIRNLCILVLFLIVIACYIISYYVTSSISEPVSRLVKVMKKTGDGKWNTRYENSGHDEITILGDRFNEMADKTDQLIDQVYLSEIKRQKISISWANARLDALLMQINPHFLYNTLDIIRWEAMYEAEGESPVTQMIEKFSRLCRMGMRTGGNTITLKEGIEHARTYLDVINFRHREKIRLEVDIQADEEAVYIPQFMLQPILENAVVHAFDDGSRGYRIAIQAIITGEALVITVCDNGKGMSQEEVDRLTATMEQSDFTNENIGLVNVNQRIRLFYGDACGIRIFSREGEGTKITISLPVRDHSENMEGNRGEEEWHTKF